MRAYERVSQALGITISSSYSVPLSTLVQVGNTLASQFLCQASADPELACIAVLNFAIAILLIGASLIHYNIAIDRWPYRPNLGYLRFALDIIIVDGLYLNLVTNVFSPRNFLVVLSAIYALYVIWDIVRCREYRGSSEFDRLLRGLEINVKFLAYVALLTAFYEITFLLPVLNSWSLRGFVIALILLLNILYRVKKLHATDLCFIAAGNLPDTPIKETNKTWHNMVELLHA